MSEYLKSYELARDDNITEYTPTTSTLYERDPERK
jgi:hypothetical protein